MNRDTRPAIETTVLSSAVKAAGRAIPAEVSKAGSPVTKATITDTTWITLKNTGVLENSLPTSSAKNDTILDTVLLVGVVVVVGVELDIIYCVRLLEQFVSSCYSYSFTEGFAIKED